MSKNPYQYSAVSYDIEVQVRPFYAKEFSDPFLHKYVYMYTVKIFNKSEDVIKLINRKWHIIEEDGSHSSIEGEGVVGQQPIIKAKNGRFEYTSQAILYTKSGLMYGEYSCKKIEKNNEIINIKIPAFSLDLSSDIHQANLS